MANYDVRFLTTAGRLLGPKSKGGKGQVVTITAPGEDVFDPATDTSMPGAPIVQTGSGVEDVYSAHSIAGGLVLVGDVQFLLSPLKADGSPITQPVADRHILTKLDGPWAIKHVDTVAPAGMPVLFKLQLRR